MGKIKTRDSYWLIFIFAASALIYEMILASTLVFLFGDSLFYFSLTIAFFILFMGLGSSASHWLTHRTSSTALSALLSAEWVVTVAGGLSSLLILWVAGNTKDGFLTSLIALALTFLIGFSAGVEIPLLYMLTKPNRTAQKTDQAPVQSDNRFRVGLEAGTGSRGGDTGLASSSRPALFGTFLMWDYFGALIGSVFFSLLLLPAMDLIGSALLLGTLNILVLLLFVFKYRKQVRGAMEWLTILSIVLIAAVVLTIQKGYLQTLVDNKIFQVSPRTQMLESFRTSYQKVMVSLTPSADVEARHREKVMAESDVSADTPWISIYLNNFTQSFAPLGSDTDFYHHAFIHPAMVLSSRRERVLVLGGGDGLPGKEINKYSDVEQIVTVDLDGEWVEFAKNNPYMRQHNFDSLKDPRVELVIDDAFHWVRMSKRTFDVIFVDFPEGVDVPLARSYSVQFLKDLKRLLSEDGVISFQTDSFNNPVYWAVVKTIQAAGFHIIPHRSLEFGDESYGFVLASRKRKELEHFEEDMVKRPFINQKMIFSTFLMNQMREDRFLRLKTDGLKINTFFHPTFLYYYRISQPWDIFIGNN